MKKYIFILLLLALLFFLAKKIMTFKLLTVGSLDWDSNKINVNVNGRSFLIQPNKDFNNLVIGEYTLNSGTFGNTVILSLKKKGEIIENLEIDFDSRTVVY